MTRPALFGPISVVVIFLFSEKEKVDLVVLHGKGERTKERVVKLRIQSLSYLIVRITTCKLTSTSISTQI